MTEKGNFEIGGIEKPIYKVCLWTISNMSAEEHA